MEQYSSPMLRRVKIIAAKKRIPETASRLKSLFMPHSLIPDPAFREHNTHTFQLLSLAVFHLFVLLPVYDQ